MYKGRRKVLRKRMTFSSHPSTSEQSSSTPTFESHPLPTQVTTETGTCHVSHAESEELPFTIDTHGQETFEASTSLGTNDGKEKKVRGPTLLTKIESMKPDKRILVQLNKYFQPIGEEGKALSQYCGVIAKRGDILPIDIIDWRHMPNSNKENASRKIMEKFEISQIPTVQSWIQKTIAKDWKTWKYRLHSQYKTSGGDKNPPNDKRVIPQQWQNLRYYWCSEQFKGKSKKNLDNRAQMLSKHYIGQRSFARLANDYYKETGNELDRSDIYVISRSRRDGTIVDPISKLRVEQIQQMKQSQTQEESKGNCHVSENDILGQVLGKDKRGRVRCLGMGPTPTQIWGPPQKKPHASHHASVEGEKMRQELDDVKLNVFHLRDELKSNMNELRDELREMKQLFRQQLTTRVGSPSTSYIVSSSKSSHDIPSPQELNISPPHHPREDRNREVNKC